MSESYHDDYDGESRPDCLNKDHREMKARAEQAEKQLATMEERLRECENLLERWAYDYWIAETEDIEAIGAATRTYAEKFMHNSKLRAYFQRSEGK